jgi:hypothetical protein
MTSRTVLRVIEGKQNREVEMRSTVLLFQLTEDWFAGQFVVSSPLCCCLGFRRCSSPAPDQFADQYASHDPHTPATETDQQLQAVVYWRQQQTVLSRNATFRLHTSLQLLDGKTQLSFCFAPF